MKGEGGHFFIICFFCFLLPLAWFEYKTTHLKRRGETGGGRGSRLERGEGGRRVRQEGGGVAGLKGERAVGGQA